MASIQPAGISSYLTWKEKQLYLQTEFALRPHPRITTTVSCEGEVIHKAEEVWEGGLRREEDKKQIEALIRKQHKRVRFMVQNKAQEILASYMPKPLPIFWEQLSQMEGIENILAFDQEGKVLYQEKESETSKKITENIISTIQLANFLSQVSKLGTLKRSTLSIENFKVIIFHRRDNYFAVHLNKEKETEEVISRIENVLS
jgi:hypothetical protein